MIKYSVVPFSMFRLTFPIYTFEQHSFLLQHQQPMSPTVQPPHAEIVEQARRMPSDDPQKTGPVMGSGCGANLDYGMVQVSPIPGNIDL